MIARADARAWRIDLEALPRGDLLVTRSQGIQVLGLRADSMLPYLAARGTLRKVRVGRVWGYLVSSLEAYARAKGRQIDRAAAAKYGVPTDTLREYPRDLVPAAEASSILGVDVEAGYLRRLRREGRLEGYWLLAEYGYSRAELEALAGG